MTTHCCKCGGTMDRGFTTAMGLMGGAGEEGKKAKLAFVTFGIPTSSNPLKAFKQGLSDEPMNQLYGIYGKRCRECGFLELFAADVLSESDIENDQIGNPT